MLGQDWLEQGPCPKWHATPKRARRLRVYQGAGIQPETIKFNSLDTRPPFTFGGPTARG